MLIVFLNCAVEHNVLLLSICGQGNNVGAAGLQCKPLQVETLMHCWFFFLYMSFRVVGASRIRDSE